MIKPMIIAVIPAKKSSSAAMSLIKPILDNWNKISYFFNSRI
jgi:hypothetical protein